MTNAEDSPEVHEAEPEEQHERGQDEPTVDELKIKAMTQTAPPNSRRLNYNMCAGRLAARWCALMGWDDLR